MRYDRKVGKTRARGEGPTIAESVIGEIVYGTNPVLERRQNSSALFALYVQEGADGSGKTRGDSEIVRLAEERNVTVKSASKHDLNMACVNKPHQGVVIDARLGDSQSWKIYHPGTALDERPCGWRWMRSWIRKISAPCFAARLFRRR